MVIKERSILAAEFIGTYLLVFVVGLTLTTGHSEAALGVFTPTAIGCALMVLVYAFGNVSGGHFNPAVTFAICMQTTMSKTDKFLPVKYMVAQCAGGALGGLSTGFLYGWEKSGNVLLGPTRDELAVAAPLVEFLYTFLLCFVVLNVAVALPKKCPVERLSEEEQQGWKGATGLAEPLKPAANEFYGLAIGFVIIAAHGASAISGAALNPAVALGVNFMGVSWKIFWLPIYAAVQMAGGFAAVTALHIVRPETKEAYPQQQQSGGLSKITQLAHRIEAMFDPEDTSEFLGTFFIALTLSLNQMIIQNAPAGTKALANPGMGWSVAAAFMVLVYSLGDISGGVFNPALTLALSGRWFKTQKGFEARTEVKTKLCDPSASPKEVIKYTIAQLLGGAAGTGATILIFLGDSLNGHWPSQQVGPQPTAPTCLDAKNVSIPFTNKHFGSPGDCSGVVHTHTYTLGQAFFAEVFGTFFLCFVVLSIATVENTFRGLENLRNLGQFHGYAVGGVIVAAGYAFGPISGGLLNPAITLAAAVGNQLSVITDPSALSYMAAQMIGGVLAAVIFKYVTHKQLVDEELKEAGEGGGALMESLVTTSQGGTV